NIYKTPLTFDSPNLSTIETYRTYTTSIQTTRNEKNFTIILACLADETKLQPFGLSWVFECMLHKDFRIKMDVYTKSLENIFDYEQEARMEIAQVLLDSYKMGTRGLSGFPV
ncbi:11729_t:CDS:2, partial [Scutellospora calospora]